MNNNNNSKEPDSNFTGASDLTKSGDILNRSDPVSTDASLSYSGQTAPSNSSNDWPAASQITKSYPLTPVGRGERFRDAYATKLFYIEQQPYIYIDNKWIEGEPHQLQGMALEVNRNIKNEIESIQNDIKDSDSSDIAEAKNKTFLDQKHKLLRFSRQGENAQQLKATIDHSRIWMTYQNDQVDTESYMIGVNNGIVDLKEDKFLQNSPAYCITRYCSADYDTAAQAPEWNKFINSIFDGDNDLIRYVQKAIGYSLTDVCSEQLIFMLIGSGANGKSTFLLTLHELLSPYSVTPDAEILLKDNNNKRFDLIDCVSKRLAIISEVGDDGFFDSERIKKLSSGEPFSVQDKFKKAFIVTPTIKLWLCANELPASSDGKAFWRRIRVIPFNQSFEGREDTKLSSKLIAEKSGILNWCIEGFRMWQKEGLKGTEPAAIQQTTEKSKLDADPVQQWINDCCIIGPGRTARFKNLFENYNEWRATNGRATMNSTNFGKRLKTKKFRAVHSQYGTEYEGLALNVFASTYKRKKRY